MIVLTCKRLLSIRLPLIFLVLTLTVSLEPRKPPIGSDPQSCPPLFQLHFPFPLFPREKRPPTLIIRNQQVPLTLCQPLLKRRSLDPRADRRIPERIALPVPFIRPLNLCSACCNRCQCFLRERLK